MGGAGGGGGGPPEPTGGGEGGVTSGKEGRGGGRGVLIFLDVLGVSGVIPGIVSSYSVGLFLSGGLDFWPF